MGCGFGFSHWQLTSPAALTNHTPHEPSDPCLLDQTLCNLNDRTNNRNKSQNPGEPHDNNDPLAQPRMASSKVVARLAASKRQSPLQAAVAASFIRPTFVPALAFSTSLSRRSGPPPAGFRLPPPKTWDQSDESSLDKASKYFLLHELFRGMWVLLEQFFRPPYVIHLHVVKFLSLHHLRRKMTRVPH